MAQNVDVAIKCDASPLLLFIEFIKSALQVCNRTITLGDLSFELARIETDNNTAGAGEITIVLYPSDAFLRFAVTLCAGNFDL